MPEKDHLYSPEKTGNASDQRYHLYVRLQRFVQHIKVFVQNGSQLDEKIILIIRNKHYIICVDRGKCLRTMPRGAGCVRLLFITKLKTISIINILKQLRLSLLLVSAEETDLVLQQKPTKSIIYIK